MWKLFDDNTITVYVLDTFPILGRRVVGSLHCLFTEFNETTTVDDHDGIPGK